MICSSLNRRFIQEPSFSLKKILAHFGILCWGDVKTSLLVGLVVEGQHFSTKAEIEFGEISFSFSHLRNWVDNRQIQSNLVGQKVMAEYEPPQNIQARYQK